MDCVVLFVLAEVHFIIVCGLWITPLPLQGGFPGRLALDASPAVGVTPGCNSTCFFGAGQRLSCSPPTLCFGSCPVGGSSSPIGYFSSLIPPRAPAYTLLGSLLTKVQSKPPKVVRSAGRPLAHSRPLHRSAPCPQGVWQSHPTASTGDRFQSPNKRPTAISLGGKPTRKTVFLPGRDQFCFVADLGCLKVCLDLDRVHVWRRVEGDSAA